MSQKQFSKVLSNCFCNVHTLQLVTPNMCLPCEPNCRANPTLVRHVSPIQSLNGEVISIVVQPDLYSLRYKFRRSIASSFSCLSYILNTPNFGSSIGAFRAALKLSPKTVRVSAGSMTPSSHNLADEKYG